ncbi:MAG: hypothetical protein V4549_17300 [Bacteroidota bacterium]
MKKITFHYSIVLMLTCCFVFQTNPARSNFNILNKCPVVALASVPSTLKTGSARVCENTLTVNTNNCNPFTFHFTWSGGSYNKTTAPGSNVLNFNLPSMTSGTTIYLVIDDNGGGSSVTYTFTSTSNC